MKAGDALEGGLGGVGGDMCAGALAAQGLEDGVDVFDRGELVVEDICPRVAPLLCIGF